ncbi:hypothetical protein LSTR_LSTR007903 [Laodelphax striatellus]|uniref:Uncharacterized protein n=1 Tax=Laodelphax striatellus TaxID=195883 RepID=A0A482WXQ2_LAOST|nr:hypothetical protein LSTR_LSTR007903 [Laodelphax striatellus]
MRSGQDDLKHMCCVYTCREGFAQLRVCEPKHLTLPQKRDDMSCEVDRKFLPTSAWSETFLHQDRRNQLIASHPHAARDKLSFQPEINGNTNGSDTSLPVDCTTCHQITADVYSSPTIKHQ